MPSTTRPFLSVIAPTVRMNGTKEVQAHLDEMAKQFGSPTRFLRAAANEYRNYMVQQFLSGQRLKRRSGRLAGAWRPYKQSETLMVLTAGSLPYSRIHEFGVDDPDQVVRPYTTKTGRKVKAYTRHMKLKARRYVSDTVINAAPLVDKKLDKIAKAIVGSQPLPKEEQ